MSCRKNICICCFNNSIHLNIFSSGIRLFEQVSSHQVKRNSNILSLSITGNMSPKFFIRFLRLEINCLPKFPVANCVINFEGNLVNRYLKLN